MHILCLFPSNEWMTWNMSHGIPPTLEAMGHHVTPYIIPDTNFRPLGGLYEAPWKDIQRQSELADLAIVTAAEKLPPQSWKDLDCKTALWFADSTGRADADFAPRYRYCQSITPHLFFCGTQDAATFNATWLPPGADTTIFHPDPNTPRKHGPSFVGHLYGKRAQLAIAIRKAGIPLETPTLEPKPWHPTEEHARAHALALANLYRSCSVNIDLPSLTHLVHSRQIEVAACGVPIIIPARTGPARQNIYAFDPPLLEYDTANLCTLTELLKHPDDLRFAAQFALAHALSHLTLHQCLTRLLETLALA